MGTKGTSLIPQPAGAATVVVLVMAAHMRHANPARPMASRGVNISDVPFVSSQIVMSWLGHAESEMVRHYFHLHDSASKAAMDTIRFTGPEAVGRPDQQAGSAVVEGGDRSEETTQQSLD